MKNWHKRIITGLVVVAIVVTCVLTGWIGFGLLVIAVNIQALREVFRLMTSPDISLQAIPAFILSTIALVMQLLVLSGNLVGYALLALVPSATVIIVIELFRKKARPFTNLAITSWAMIYVTLPLSFLTAIAFWGPTDSHYDHHILLGYFIILWAGDSAAFAGGTFLGNRKLFPRVSPNKTWEGSITGFLCALLAGWLFSRFDGSLSATLWICLAAVINVTGTLGDLSKSLLKRSAGVKDSGNLLPGHGGILDRFDSLLGSAPFVFLFLQGLRYV